MNIKEKWINEFTYLLNVYDPKIDSLNKDYSYQLAVAYFDCGDDGLPEYSVEEAFNRYKENQE